MLMLVTLPKTVSLIHGCQCKTPAKFPFPAVWLKVSVTLQIQELADLSSSQFVPIKHWKHIGKLHSVTKGMDLEEQPYSNTVERLTTLRAGVVLFC